MEKLIAAAHNNDLSSDLFAAGTVEPSIADICLIPMSITTSRFGVDYNEYPFIRKVVNKCNEIAAIQAAAPQNQPYYVDRK